MFDSCLELVTKMPIVEHEIKLDFKDVLIRPKRSTIKSRADVSIVLCSQRARASSGLNFT